ncbi:cuticle protein 16.5-like [Anopheles nili]|uniref:cuticle protein 16.5-like n=1 Tax=Anopheles nili TaxID=185578 RepID=UPI00237C2EA7|nr:cuticle protein 16.5-like [Anopheles nili]
MKILLVILGVVAAVRAAPGYYGDHGLSYVAAAPAPIVKYAAPAVSVVHAAPAPVLKYAVAPAPIVKAVAAPAATSYATIHQVHAPVVHAAPIVKYAAPAPVVSYVHSAPVVAHAPAPLLKYASAYHGW